MITFRQFITEKLETPKALTHLEHPEDLMMSHGHEGFNHAVQALKDVHDHINGKFNKTNLQVKVDGSPSILFGHDPQTHKFFVATKSAFNKDPKINYTDEDIIKNHGDKPGLVEKLMAALHHLPKVTPKTGVYQGDMMHTRNDVTEAGGNYNFTPNTVMNSVPMKSEEGKKIAASKMGIAVHSKYIGPSLTSMHHTFDPDLHNFKPHKDVHMFPIHVIPGAKDKESSTVFEHHIKRAEKEHEMAHPETLAIIKHHAPSLATYINSTVREGTTPTTAGYRKHLMQQGDKDMGKVTTAKAKQQHHDKMMGHMNYVEEHSDKFDAAFKMHHHLQKAKDALVKALNHHGDYEYSMNGKKTGPEGYIAVTHGHPIKLVDRAEFSKQNMAKHSAPK